MHVTLLYMFDLLIPHHAQPTDIDHGFDFLMELSMVGPKFHSIIYKERILKFDPITLTVKG